MPRWMTKSGAPLKGSKYMKKRAYLKSKGECTRPYPTQKSSKSCNKFGTGSGRRYRMGCVVPKWSEKKQDFIPPCVKKTVKHMRG